MRAARRPLEATSRRRSYKCAIRKGARSGLVIDSACAGETPAKFKSESCEDVGSVPTVNLHVALLPASQISFCLEGAYNWENNVNRKAHGLLGNVTPLCLSSSSKT